MNPVRLWRYQIPSENGEGWAVFVLGSDGFFATVNDYHNCAFRWPDPGVNDFREFFLNVPQRKDYFIRKLSNGEKRYDAKQTKANVKEALTALSEMERTIAEELMEDTYNNLDREEDFFGWVSACTSFDSVEIHSFYAAQWPSMVERLVIETLPKMEALIREQLQNELATALVNLTASGSEAVEELRKQALAAGADFYYFVAAHITGRSIHTFSKSEREVVKQFLFATTYGMSGEKFTKVIK